MNTSEAQSFAEKREVSLIEAYNAGNVDKVLSFFSKDAVFTDHTTLAQGIDKVNYDSMGQSLQGLFTATKDLKCTTTKVYATTPEFAVWEGVLTCVIAREMPGVPMKVGTAVKAPGVVLSYWKKGSSDEWYEGWLRVKEDSYFILRPAESA